MSPSVKGVHFVGSFPHKGLTTARDVFVKALALCPDRVHRIPDGELGDTRWCYVAFEYDRFPEHILVSADPESIERLGRSYTPKIDDIKPSRYDIYAKESYSAFVKAREAGEIPQGVRFQVSIPSPIESLGHIHAAYRQEVAPLLEQRILECVKRLQDQIPAKDLAIQWDLAGSIANIESQRGKQLHPVYAPKFTHWTENDFETALQSMERALKVIGPDVELGFHLCYGDLGSTHFLQPDDLGLLVEVGNRLLKAVDRPVQWFHMPVPKDRTDPAYFAPLKDFNLDTNTELFLGLLHYDDLGGTQKRIEAAKSVLVRDFGVATECGMGRMPPDQLDGILKLAAQVTEPYNA